VDIGEGGILNAAAVEVKEAEIVASKSEHTDKSPIGLVHE
jgi:hypothetical protein